MQSTYVSIWLFCNRPRFSKPGKTVTLREAIWLRSNRPRNIRGSRKPWPRRELRGPYSFSAARTWAARAAGCGSIRTSRSATVATRTSSPGSPTMVVARRTA
uniref:Uncharacterized protein n=1 Tax=Anopheles melas TaxID=34690 RepID=A0A182TEJ0_9DIPT